MTQEIGIGYLSVIFSLIPCGLRGDIIWFILFDFIKVYFMA